MKRRVACLPLDGRGGKKGKGSIQFFARHGEGRSELQGRLVQLLLFWSCWGSEQRKGPRPETTPEQKRYRPRVLETIGDDWLGRQFSTKSQFPGCRGLGFSRGQRYRYFAGYPCGSWWDNYWRQTRANARWATVCPTASTATRTGISRRPASTSMNLSNAPIATATWNAARFFQPSVSTQDCQLYTRSSSPLQTIVLIYAIHSSKWSKRQYWNALGCFTLVCSALWHGNTQCCTVFLYPPQPKWACHNIRQGYPFLFQVIDPKWPRDSLIESQWTSLTIH